MSTIHNIITKLKSISKLFIPRGFSLRRVLFYCVYALFYIRFVLKVSWRVLFFLLYSGSSFSRSVFLWFIIVSFSSLYFFFFLYFLVSSMIGFSLFLKLTFLFNFDWVFLLWHVGVIHLFFYFFFVFRFPNTFSLFFFVPHSALPPPKIFGGGSLHASFQWCECP